MPKNLLLADDSITIQKVVGITFANEDYKVTSVDNGEDAVAKARELNPDVILADVVMPRKNGYELCEAVKNDPSLQHIPVLLLAGTFEAFDETRARAVKADGHISKPFESGALINKVKELVGDKSATAPAAAPARPAAPAPARPAAPVQGRPAGPPPGAAGPAMAGPRPGAPMPPGARPPGPGAPPPGGFRPGGPVPPGARPPPGPFSPGAPRPPGAMAPGAPRPPGAGPVAPRPGGPVPPAGARPPGPAMPPAGARPVIPPAAPRPGAPFSPGARPPGAFTPPGGPAARPAPPPSGFPGPAGGAAPSARRDPFGFGVGEAPKPPAARPPAPQRPEEDFGDLDADRPGIRAAGPISPPLDLSMDVEDATAPLPKMAGRAVPAEEPDGRPPLAPMHTFVPPADKTGHRPEPAGGAGDGGEAALREALSKASREVIERIVWEVVPELAETIIRENLDRLVKERQG